MSNIKKTCKQQNSYKIKQNSQNKKKFKAQNNNMDKNKDNCNFHVMPPQISDSDISALFNGIINIVKKKIELEKKAEILNANISLEKALKEIKSKQAEIVRLKNEINSLKAQLNQKRQ